MIKKYKIFEFERSHRITWDEIGENNEEQSSKGGVKMEWTHVENGKPVQFKSVYFSIDEAVYKGMYVNHSFYDHATGNYLEADYWMPVTDEQAPFPVPPNIRS